MRIKFIPVENNKQIVYLPDSIKTFMANNETAKVIKCIANKESFSCIQNKFPDLSETSYNYLIRKLESVKKQSCISENEKHLGRLVINISNDCNLRCKYCYANCGTYYSAKNLISLKTLKSTLDMFYKLFDKIDVLQLFGGEPTLNIDAMEYACKYIMDHNYKTQVGFVTNGTLVTKRLIDIINNYKLSVTVSIDVENMHDQLRPFEHDIPSFQCIKNNIHRLQESTSQPSQFELTYTNKHKTAKITIANIIRELHTEFGSIPVHITPVCSDNPAFHLTDRNSFINSVHDIFEANKNGEKLGYSMLNALELNLKHHVQQNYFCGAGIGTLAVSTTGEIYPCFYFIDNKNYLIAKVTDSSEKVWTEIVKTRKYYINHKKNNTDKCKDCFANTLCHGCIGCNYCETGDPFTCSDLQCEMTKRMLENTLIEFMKPSCAGCK